VVDPALIPKKHGVREKWFGGKTSPGGADQSGKGRLPGSAEQRGFGAKPAAPAAGRLTRALTYEGPAWYQREITVPAAWQGKRVELFLERCHWESTVWLDGRRTGRKDSLSAPHLHDLGILSPGRHTLTVCVDNTYKLPIGLWAHAITEETQGNWNGIIGRIELRATDPVWIRSVQVYPKTLKVSVGNQTGQAVEANIQGTRCTIPIGGGAVEAPFSDRQPPWDEFAPVTRTLGGDDAGRLVPRSETVATASAGSESRTSNSFERASESSCAGRWMNASIPLTGYRRWTRNPGLRYCAFANPTGSTFMHFILVSPGGRICSRR